MERAPLLPVRDVVAQLLCPFRRCQHGWNREYLWQHLEHVVFARRWIPGEATEPSAPGNFDHPVSDRKFGSAYQQRGDGGNNLSAVPGCNDPVRRKFHTSAPAEKPKTHRMIP